MRSMLNSLSPSRNGDFAFQPYIRNELVRLICFRFLFSSVTHSQFEGRIPTELGKLKKLHSMDLHDNNLTGSVPREVCNLKLKELVVDCLGPKPEVQCDCCTVCCRGLPDFKCVDVKTGQEIQRQ